MHVVGLALVVNSKPVSLKGLMFFAVLWLPISFYFWFQWSGLLVAPVALLVEQVLKALLDEQFRALVQSGYRFVIEIYFVRPDGTQLTLNPMIYGYGLPLLSGLVISTPNPIWLRGVQLLLGWLVICLVQSWGIVWETLKQLSFYLGDDGLGVMANVGVSAELVALAYQFGYLIFPAVVPVALWILLNPHFIESMVMQQVSPAHGETPDPDRGQLE